MREYFVRYKIIANSPVFEGDLKTGHLEKIRNIKEGIGSLIWLSYIEPSDFFKDLKYKISVERLCEEDEIDIITLNCVYENNDS